MQNQSEQLSQLGQRFQTLMRRLDPLWQRLWQLLRQGWKLIVRFFRWINSIDIPLSQRQWLVLFFVVFGVIYIWATPIFEASDERWHFGMVEHIVKTGELPVQDPLAEDDTPYRQEGSQPPLYYLIAAGLISPLDLSDIEEVRQPNPHVIAGNAATFGNKNVVIHQTPHPTPQGTALAVYVLRLLGVGLGVVTVLMAYECGKLVAPHRPIVALLAGGLTALNPMFLFISASVNNDTLVTALNSVVIYLLLRMIRDGF